MGDVTIAVLAVVAAAFAVMCIGFTLARNRDERRRQDRLSLAFDRAQAVRTRGNGLQGSPYGVYAEPVWTIRRDRRGR